MFTLKFDGQMDGRPPWHLDAQTVANVDFRLERLNPQTFGSRLLSGLVGVVQGPALALLQLLPPVRIGRLLIVTRDADVRHVLENHANFVVHYNPEMRELGDDTNSRRRGDDTDETSFLLALDGCPHDLRRRQLLATMTEPLNEQAVARTTQVATELLANCGGRINVMKDYFCRAAAEAAIAYLGLAIDDADSFAECTLAMSTMIFGDPFGKAEVREMASHAAWRLRSVADRSIALARLGKASGQVQLLADRNQASDAEIRATLLGLATALVPTNTLAAGKMLAYLLRDPDAWRQAVAAANRSDDSLRQVLLEAARLNPALNPGQFRYVPVDTRLPGHGRRIRANTVVLAATAAALRDPRAFPSSPGRFRPGRTDRAGRPFDGGLMFGDASHACLGQDLAIRQIVAMFRPLLRQPGLARAPGAAGKIRFAGPFPRQLDLLFDAPAHPGIQSMLKIAVPCPALGTGDDSAKAMRAQIEALGNPVRVDALRGALDAAAVVHFASINLVDAGAEQPVRHHLLVEVNVDGPLAGAEAAASTALGPTLLGVLGGCGHETYWGHLLDRYTLPDFLCDHRVRIQAWPWGATGLDFLGSRELPLAAQARDAELTAFATRAVDLYRRLRETGGKRGMEALRFVRAAIRQDPATWPTRRDALLALQPELADEFAGLEAAAAAQNFAGALTMPSADRLGFADWQAKTFGEKATETLLAPDMMRTLAICGVAAVAVAALLLALAGLVPAARVSSWMAWIGLVVVLAVVLLVIVATGVAGLLYRILRSRENKDRPDDRDPDPDIMTKIAGLENPPGFAQNHFLSVSRFKPGLFRRFTFAFALWGIGIYVRFWARPGFIEDMGTIHFAGWFRLPGTDRMVFHANFDGSWESYLEDFVTKAHLGQTAVWSNADGFPRARNLVAAGASDGDHFKRWVRRQQVPTQFWYSRLPALTLARARTNAIVRAGLARAGSDTEARAWLACFGSQAALPDTIETDEVQSIVFDSLPSHAFAACLLIDLPGAGSQRAEFFAELRAGRAGGMPKLRFGDMVPGAIVDPVVGYLALSAGGLEKCCLPGQSEADGLASFQHPFVAGMASRGRVLGDDPGRWLWNDRAADAVLWVMAERAMDRDAAVAATETRLTELGGKVLHAVPTDPVGGKSINTGHFRFADGNSQPVLRGSNAAATALERDRVAPGEFLFGYQNGQGCLAPSPRLRAELDPLSLLPDTSVNRTQRFPVFQPDGQPPLFRDFGRNGSYLVIRQLEQDAAGFWQASEDHAEDLKRRYPGLEAAPGVPVSAEWVAAKQIGRWPDGTPLVRRVAPPDMATPKPNDPLLDDFSYARDDPQGLRCPLGAHIRRANPRDSLQPDDPDGPAITNRHRIIRRGRSYTVPREQGLPAETGLMFAAVCADLERQFEFVQQRWIGSTDFHGLDEADPLLATTGRFTVPTVDGPIRLTKLDSHVTVRGGGYFFLLSRSALRYFEDRCAC